MLTKDRDFYNPVKRFDLDDLELTSIFVDPDPKKMQSCNHSRNAHIPIVIDYGSHSTKAVSINAKTYNNNIIINRALQTLRIHA